MICNHFPLGQLNEAREDCFASSRDEKELNDVQRAGAWLGHKALTVIGLPANCAAVGLGMVGMAATAGIIGTLKAAIFAATLGHVKPTFPTGFLWSAEVAAQGVLDIAINVSEVIRDVGNAIHQGYRLIHWLGEKLSHGFIKEAFHQIGQAFKFIGNQLVKPAINFAAKRIDEGIRKAVECEKKFPHFPSLLSPLNTLAKESRIDWSAKDRPLDKILKHYAVSVISVPVNVVAAVCAMAASVILSSAFLGKVACYAITKIDIPIPTFAGQAIGTSYEAIENTVLDVANDVADGFALIYRVSEALRIKAAVAKVMQVLSYVPEACFGS